MDKVIDWIGLKEIINVSFLFLDGQVDGEGRAFAGLAYECDFSVEQFDELLGDGQSEPGAEGFMAAVIIELREGLENVSLFFDGDTGAGVFDFEPQPLFII